LKVKILFAGTPAIAVPTLQALQKHHQVVAVLTAGDTKAGRGQELQAPAVKLAACEYNIPVLQPERLDAVFRNIVACYSPDMLVCVAYGKLFGPRFLALFPQGGINMHPSLLPLYRGPSPISAAILDGCTSTGISIQRLAQGMDEGDILLQKSLPLDGTETCESLSRTCASEGALLVLQALENLQHGRIAAHVQDHTKATYCHLIRKEDGLIDWTAKARSIACMVRAYDPWPKAHTLFRGIPLAVLEVTVAEQTQGNQHVPGTIVSIDKTQGILVQTGEGILAIRRLHVQSKKPTDARSFSNGVRDLAGSKLGE